MTGNLLLCILIYAMFCYIIYAIAPGDFEEMDPFIATIAVMISPLWATVAFLAGVLMFAVFYIQLKWRCYEGFLRKSSDQRE